MCDVCGAGGFFCTKNCPEQETGPEVVCLCAQCGNEIYEGDDIYDINEEKWCEECVNGYRGTAELDED